MNCNFMSFSKSRLSIGVGELCSFLYYYASNAHHFNNYATKNLIMLNIDRVQRSPQSQLGLDKI